MVGGAGADHFRGGRGEDRVDYDRDQYGDVDDDLSGVWVDLSTGRGYYGHAAGDTYSGVENVGGSAASDTLIGDVKDNWLSGGFGNDYLKGLAGDDLLHGSDGNDTLEGNAGADRLEGRRGGDVFVYKQASDSTHDAMDEIIGWDDQWTWGVGREYDKFDFRELDANPFVSGNQALDWIGEAGFTGIGQIKEVRGAGATYVEVNLDNDVNDSEMIIKITEPVNLAAADFWL